MTFKNWYYSPDLNKVAQGWSELKSRIRKQLDQFDCLVHATLEFIAPCVLTAKAVAINSFPENNRSIWIQKLFKYAINLYQKMILSRY
jgi:hypothetical protein